MTVLLCSVYEGLFKKMKSGCCSQKFLLALCSSPLQVVVDHDYLGPLCLQFTGLPSVADVKNEIMERHGLPVKDQTLYFDGKKVLVIVLKKKFN